MTRDEEIKPGMYAEDLPEEERREEYTLSEDDRKSILRRIRSSSGDE